MSDKIFIRRVRCCAICPARRSDNHGGYECAERPSRTFIDGGYTGFPEWCPLKQWPEMAEKKEE